MDTINKSLVIGLAAGALMLAGAGLSYMTVREIRQMIHEAGETATKLTNANWSAKFEKQNAAANRKIADQAQAVIEIQADAADRVNAASQQLEELRKRNAALPNGDDLGLSAERGRLLPD